ncbi:MAG TPA: HEAT repeat domain-containing protein, partial [Gemmataceae bacterium]|nr:HEAT repeat domain-containing protein [Gemmataceae bacterium]
MCRTFAATGWILLSVGLALGDNKPRQPAPADVPVEKLIEQLGNKDYKAREAASKALEAKGEAALDAMRKAAAGANNPEVRRRLDILITNVDRMIILAPKRITLKVKDKPMQEVVAEVAKQSGYKMQLQGAQQQLVTLDFDKATFWQVMDRICMEAGLVMYQNEGQAIQLYQQDSFSPYNCYQGPFKVSANNIHYSKTITLGPMPRNPQNNTMRNENMQFNFAIYSEPKLPIMGVGQVKLLEAIDEKGQSMLPAGPNQHEVYYHQGGGYRMFAYNTQVQLLWPDKEARYIKSIKGTVPVTLLADQKPEITVEDILKAKKQKVTGATAEIQIDEVNQPNKTSVEIKMTVTNLKGGPNDYSWTNSVHQRVELQDGKGNKYFSHGYNWINSSQSSVSATFTYGTNGDANIGPPAKLIYQHW